MAASNKTCVQWTSLKPSLHPSIIKVLNESNFLEMKPVQLSSIPPFLNHKDVVVEAVTGSGKTLAFVIPLLQKLLSRSKPLRPNEIGALIVTPTRELALQIHEVISMFLKADLGGLTQALFVGGASTASNIEHFQKKGGNIVTATPGRLEDLLSNCTRNFNLNCSLKTLDILILDEADRILDLGFEKSINNILQVLPKQRRTGLFSATQTKELSQLIRAGMRNPVRVTVKEVDENQMQIRTPNSLNVNYMVTDSYDKFNQLCMLLNDNNKHMVFFSTCASVKYFTQILKKIFPKKSILCIHRKLDKKRNNIFNSFRSLTNGVLLCTDVMARGVDIPQVDWVIQYDAPTSANAFVHRCGRTARMGVEGNALIFLRDAEDAYVLFLEKNQSVYAKQMEPLKCSKDYVPLLRKLCLADNSVHEDAIRAFVSFIRSYTKHECNLLFNVKELDFGVLATSFGLLRMPHMPELKGIEVVGFTPAEGQQKDPVSREEPAGKRKSAEAVNSTQSAKKKKGQTESWSKSIQTAAEKAKKRKKRRMAKVKRKEAKQANAAATE